MERGRVEGLRRERVSENMMGVGVGVRVGERAGCTYRDLTSLGLSFSSHNFCSTQ